MNLELHPIINKSYDDHVDTLSKSKNQLKELEFIAAVCKSALSNGNKVLFCGNGGSAADSQHLAAELVGRYKKERKSLPSIALTTDTSIITAIANDYEYNTIFSRQVEGLGKEGDVLIGISTSGNSKNVIEAIKLANQKGIITVGFTGNDGGQMAEFCKYMFNVPSNITARIQEMHILAGHILCELIEEDY
ncbi:D-sedoheptulose 7-phosphate isomerase [Veillonella rodentium]|uniref:Phosphoheptose isomerase n=1 Tax=Veillonella rodentium TaxID=248315 RepID=A0A239XZJ6_9FIRM|nr:D-sedoheptulose 7-phosphate isomerase [Veillonella rodentium]SNV52225.1 Phosphoheptose isomerase 1 [Veillonella rodentium]